MSVKILNRKYKEIFTDGITDWMIGNVGEWQKQTIQVEVAIEYQATQEAPIQIDLLNNAFVMTNGGNWGQKGFDIGMTVVFKFKYLQDLNNDGIYEESSNYTSEYLITNIYGNIMEVSQAIESLGFQNLPTDYGTRKITNVVLYVDKIPEGCRLKYSHISNDDFETESLNSVIDGTTTELGFKNLSSLQIGQFGTMQAFGQQSGMSIRSGKVRRINAPTNNNSAVMVKYKNNGNPSLTIAARKAAAFMMNKTSSGYPEYKNVTQNSLLTGNYPTYNDANLAQCFLVANANYSQNLSITASAKVTTAVDVASNDFIALSIIKVTSSGFFFQSRIELKRWNNASSLLGSVLNYGNDIQLEVESGFNYVLVWEYFHPDAPIATGVIIQVQNVEIEGGFPNQLISGNYKKYYEIELEYMISSIFEEIVSDSELAMPTYLQNGKSLTDNFDISFFPEWNNPNVVVRNDIKKTARLGNTGWFNENYNGLENKFSVDELKYFDEDGNLVDSLDYTKLTKVRAVISGVTNLNSITECGFGFAWLPTDEVDYKNKESAFYRNLFIQSGSLENGFNLNQNYAGPYFGAGLQGASMDASNVKFSTQGANIVFECSFVPNVAFSSVFEAKNANDRNYIIWISVADGSLQRNYSDRVSLLADKNELVKNIPPAGPYPFIENSFIEHPYSETAQGEIVYNGLIQDDLLCRMPFRISKSGDTIFRLMRFGVEAFNASTGESFTLENYDVDFTQFPTDSNGVQQVNFNQSRGFKLNEGNNKNWFKVNREESLDTVNFNGYMAYFGTKIRWEDWIQNQNAPSSFFNAQLLNNGFSNDWFAYQNAQGWIINFFTEIEAFVDSELVSYKNQWQMKFADYDQNEKVQTRHRYYRDSDNTLLNVGTDPETGKPLGVVVFNEPTRIEVDFEILDSGIWTLPATYVVLTLEIDKGAGRFEQRQISTEYITESDNPLIPIDGQNKLSISVDGTGKVLTAKCLVDPELLQVAERYRITCRSGCKNDQGEFVTGLYEFRYEETYE